jgi:hypothetical protein
MGSMAGWAVVLAMLASDPSIKTAAGTGEAGDGGDGGPAMLARLNMPFDLAVDARGNLYFSDTFNHRVRKIDRVTGTITTVAGNGKAGFSGDGGPALQAQLDEPYGVVLDQGGNPPEPARWAVAVTADRQRRHASTGRTGLPLPPMELSGSPIRTITGCGSS